MNEEYENWQSLLEISEEEWCNVSMKQLQQWTVRRETNGFPEPVYTQGKFTFYDPAEVKKWMYFHQKATRNMHLRSVK